MSINRNSENMSTQGDYKPPQALAVDIEQQKESNSNKVTGIDQNYRNYSQFTQIDGKKQQNDQKQNSKIGRKVSWLTSQSSDSDTSTNSQNQNNRYTNQYDANTAICFDGIKYGLMGALNLYMKDNFTSYIVRGIQARNPNVGVVQILANSTVQKCKQILSRVRFECFLLIFIGFIFLLTELIILIQSFTNENPTVIILLTLHFLVTIGMLWTNYTSSRYFLPDKAKISMGLCVLLLITVIGVIVAKSDESRALPNSISVLLLIQFLTSGLLYHINRQILLIYKIFV